MTNNKTVQVKIRMTKEEKDYLEKIAEENYVSVNEYVLNLINSNKYGKQTIDNRVLSFFEDHLPLLYRLLVKSTIKVEHLAMEQLSDDKFKEAQKIEYHIIKDLGVRLEDEDKDDDEKIKW